MDPLCLANAVRIALHLVENTRDRKQREGEGYKKRESRLVLYIASSWESETKEGIRS